jgi:hypothetical protein
MASMVPEKVDWAVSEEELDEIESDTLRNAAKTVSAIEDAISVWNAAMIKPQDMGPTLERLKRFRTELMRWGTECGRLHAGRAARQTRIDTLRKFVRICYKYENA